MKKRPRVSVVIPAYFSFATVAACLESLRAQRFRDFEVILVNSSPEDTTSEIVRGRFPEVIFEQSPARLLPHAARNRGVELASGQLIVFTDPDCIAAPDWLGRLVAAHGQGHQFVAGAMGLGQSDWFGWGVHLCKFHWALPGLSPGPRWIAPTANVLLSRRAWQAAGPLDGDIFAGDALLSWRAAAAGFAPWFEPRAIVRHQHGGTLRSLWRERLQRGREFGLARSRYEGWSHFRLAAGAALAPVLPILVLARAGVDAFRGGRGIRYLQTLPVQAAGHWAWSAGEAQAQASALFERRGEEKKACASA